MEILTIVNRTSKTLQGTWDGRHYDIEPGKHSFPRIQAEAFKRQNPVMGSEDPYTGAMDYLIGFEGIDDCSPIEQNVKAPERWDRKRSGLPQDVQIVKGNGLYSPRFDSPSNLPSDGQGFVNPKV